MGKTKWHILKTDEGVTLTRRLPVRFDVAAETVLAHGSATRLAHQVRQDMWRALQNLRGFAPVVQVARRHDGMHVKAGGAIAGAIAKTSIEARLADLLSDPKLRARWVGFASRREGHHV